MVWMKNLKIEKSSEDIHILNIKLNNTERIYRFNFYEFFGNNDISKQVGGLTVHKK